VPLRLVGSEMCIRDSQNTTEELSFFAVEVELWRIGDSPLAPKFEVVAKPNEWAKTGREQTKAAANATPTKQLQLKLWHALVDVLAQKAPNIRPQTPRPQHWLNIAIGRAGFKIAPTASHKDDRLGVEVYIFHNESKKMYEALLSQKPSIEQALGFELDWQELPDAHACRIAIWRQDSPIEDEAQWGAYLDWFVQRIVKMNTVFRPVIQAIG
jgi:hypothetical protein